MTGEGYNVHAFGGTLALIQTPEYVTVEYGVSTDRPSGNPCLGCGRQVRTERRTPVLWPNGDRTTEAVCSRCYKRYPLVNQELTYGENNG